MNTRQELLEKRFTRDPNFVYRRIADECLLVPIRHQVADLNYIYVLNPVAGRIWELIDGERRVQDLRDQLKTEYEISSQEAEEDLLEFIEQLMEIGGIRRT